MGWAQRAVWAEVYRDTTSGWWMIDAGTEYKQGGDMELCSGLDMGNSRLNGAKTAHLHWSQPHVGHRQGKDVDFKV